MRTVIIEVRHKLVMKIDEGVEVAHVIDELDCTFEPSDHATVEDSEMLDYEIKDSR